MYWWTLDVSQPNIYNLQKPFSVLVSPNIQLSSSSLLCYTLLCCAWEWLTYNHILMDGIRFNILKQTLLPTLTKHTQCKAFLHTDRIVSFASVFCHKALEITCTMFVLRETYRTVLTSPLKIREVINPDSPNFFSSFSLRLDSHLLSYLNCPKNLWLSTK